MMNEDQQALIARIKELQEQQCSHWTGNYPGNELDQKIWRLALAAITQPASPALKLPDVPPNALVALCEKMYDHRSIGAAVAHDVWQDCIEELRIDAPHTAPIEPICATGGAGWVKCSDRMPLELSDEHISEVEVIVTDGTTVGTCEYRRGYLPRPWAEWSIYGDIDADEITHWQPMPSAPGA